MIAGPDSDPRPSFAMPIAPLSVTAYTLTSALGPGLDATSGALRDGRSGLRPCDPARTGLATWIGRIEGLADHPLPEPLARFDCRNNRLADLALEQDGFLDRVARALAEHGPHRVGVFLGTSTSGLEHTEMLYREHAADGGPGPAADLRFEHTHNVASLASFCRARLGLRGPALVVSTACSSSAKVFAVAHRHIAAGLCDAAVVGGADTLCATTLHGFASLDLLSPEVCRPWGAQRRGISLGEAAGFALLERTAANARQPVLLGYGESSDAHHISSPHPHGEGALIAMRAALERAGLTPDAIDYVNLHATGTPANDRAEDRAIARCFGRPPRASGTKGWTGHTLGAAGVTEVVICLLALERGLLPGTLNRGEADPGLSTEVLPATQAVQARRVMTNSFGFGGSNCALILGQAA